MMICDVLMSYSFFILKFYLNIMNKVYLKPKKEESLLRFHPWVFILPTRNTLPPDITR